MNQPYSVRPKVSLAYPQDTKRMSDPSVIRPEVSEMQARAAVCNTLMGSTPAMRAAARKYLPQEPKETDESYLARLGKAVLFPAFEDAIDSMVGKPLGRQIILESVPKEIEIALENANLAGSDLDTFARSWFKQSLVDGIGWVLVDYPTVPQGLTLADERAIRARPYLVHIPLANVLGWKARTVGGDHQLVQFRWRETFEKEDGDYGVEIVERIKVWEPGLVKVYIMDGGAWTLDEEQSGSVTIQEIPVVCFNPGSRAFFTAEPPLEDLAWLNVQHWQSSSDQRHILHVARVPILTADNTATDPQTGKVIEVSPNSLTVGYVNLRYVEHSGAAIGAGRQDLLDLKEEMQSVAGKVLTTNDASNMSATRAALEARDGGSKLLQWTWDFQDSLEDVLRLMSAWIGRHGESGGTANVSIDWLEKSDPTMFALIQQARLAGLISQKSYLAAAQQHGVLPNGVTSQDEMELFVSEMKI